MENIEKSEQKEPQKKTSLFPKIPFGVKLILKLSLKYLTPFVLGIFAAVQEPWRSILKKAWEMFEAFLQTMLIIVLFCACTMFVSELFLA